MRADAVSAASEQDELEVLTEFLYRVPIGLLRFQPDGTISIMTPPAAMLLMQVVPDLDLSNAYTALAPLAPDLAGRIAAFRDRSGVVLDCVRCEVTLGNRLASLSLTIHRLDGDCYMGVLIDSAFLADQQRKMALTEAALAQKSQFFEAALDHMSEGLLLVDADRRVQVCNRQATRTFGLPEELVASQPLFEDLLRWQLDQGEFGDKADEVEKALRSFMIVGGGSDTTHVYERSRPNGAVQEIRTTPVSGGGIVCTFSDITAQRDIEMRLRAARDKADAGIRAKSEFLATISHEIRSPLSALVGVIEALRETGLDPAQRDMANMAHGSAHALLAVLNDVLDFSKIEAGAMAIAPEPVNLRELVAHLANPLMLQAGRKGIDLTLRFDADVPSYAITDPLRLRQILNNLLSNAMKFTAQGEIAVDVDVVHALPSSPPSSPPSPPPSLRFAVRDTGIGMSEAVQSRLFEPFTQADGSTTRDFGGTGLGLCICRRLAGLLSGSLTVTSRVGEGSLFTLTLPLIPAEAPALAAESNDSLHAPGSSPDGAFGGLRALVVDDDPTIRWLSQRHLERLGVRADAAEDGETALMMLDAARPGPERYDLLLTDCHMPRMDGVALTRTVRGAPEPVMREMLIIGVTADVTDEQRERCRDAGMNDVATKPLNRAHLATLLSRFVSRHRTQAESAAMAAASSPPAPLGAPTDAPLFDDGTYRDLFAPDDPEGGVWLGEYLSDAEGVAAGLLSLLATDGEAGLPREAIVAAAHRFAGAALSVGAMRLGAAARGMESAASHENAAALRARGVALQAEFAAAKAAIAEYAQRAAPALH